MNYKPLKEVRAQLTDFDCGNDDLNVYLKYKIHIHKDAIRHICVLEELNPKIIITTSNDKTDK